MCTCGHEKSWRIYEIIVVSLWLAKNLLLSLSLEILQVRYGIVVVSLWLAKHLLLSLLLEILRARWKDNVESALTVSEIEGTIYGRVIVEASERGQKVELYRGTTS